MYSVLCQLQSCGLINRVAECSGKWMQFHAVHISLASQFEVSHDECCKFKNYFCVTTHKHFLRSMQGRTPKFNLFSKQSPGLNISNAGDSDSVSTMFCSTARGGDYRGDGVTRPPNILVGGGRKRKCPPTNCPFSYFVDICLMFASQIQLKIINFFVC